MFDQIKHRLYEWNIPHMLWEYGKSRGMTPEQFGRLYRDFIASHANRRNQGGKLVLGDRHRAQQWAFNALRDVGWPAAQSLPQVDPNWQPVRTNLQA